MLPDLVAKRIFKIISNIAAFNLKNTFLWSKDFCPGEHMPLYGTNVPKYLVLWLWNLRWASQFQMAKHEELPTVVAKKVKSGQSWFLWKSYQLWFCTWLTTRSRVKHYKKCNAKGTRTTHLSLLQYTHVSRNFRNGGFFVAIDILVYYNTYVMTMVLVHPLCSQTTPSRSVHFVSTIIRVYSKFVCKFHVLFSTRTKCPVLDTVKWPVRDII